jgi:putative xylitol transport system ATP-binding protein
VRDNISLPALRKLSRLGFVKTKAERSLVDMMIGRFHVKTRSSNTPVLHLSGGNQQKVVLAKCLSTNPRLLICDEPTRGIDENSKREIYAFLAQFVSGGNGVLFISSEIPELIANTDRIVVFRSGKIVAEVQSRSATQEQLLHLAS